MAKTNLDTLQLDGDALYDSSGNRILAGQQASITDAITAHDISATFTDTEVEAALDALGVKLNAILTALKAHGLIA